MDRGMFLGTGSRLFSNECDDFDFMGKSWWKYIKTKIAVRINSQLFFINFT
jgi:hypothetical protein